MICDRPIWMLMQDAATELSPPYTAGDIVAWFAQHYPKVKASSVRARVKGLTANDPSSSPLPGERWGTAEMSERLTPRRLL